MASRTVVISTGTGGIGRRAAVVGTSFDDFAINASEQCWSLNVRIPRLGSGATSKNLMLSMAYEASNSGNQRMNGRILRTTNIRKESARGEGSDRHLSLKAPEARSSGVCQKLETSVGP
jgi:hypothetical protein